MIDYNVSKSYGNYSENKNKTFLLELRRGKAGGCDKSYNANHTLWEKIIENRDFEIATILISKSFEINKVTLNQAIAFDYMKEDLRYQTNTEQDPARDNTMQIPFGVFLLNEACKRWGSIKRKSNKDAIVEISSMVNTVVKALGAEHLKNNKMMQDLVGNILVPMHSAKSDMLDAIVLLLNHHGAVLRKIVIDSIIINNKSEILEALLEKGILSFDQKIKIIVDEEEHEKSLQEYLLEESKQCANFLPCMRVALKQNADFENNKHLLVKAFDAGDWDAAYFFIRHFNVQKENLLEQMIIKVKIRKDDINEEYDQDTSILAQIVKCLCTTCTKPQEVLNFLFSNGLVDVNQKVMHNGEECSLLRLCLKFNAHSQTFGLIAANPEIAKDANSNIELWKYIAMCSQSSIHLYRFAPHLIRNEFEITKELLDENISHTIYNTPSFKAHSTKAIQKSNTIGKRLLHLTIDSLHYETSYIFGYNGLISLIRKLMEVDPSLFQNLNSFHIGSLKKSIYLSYKQNPELTTCLASTLEEQKQKESYIKTVIFILNNAKNLASELELMLDPEKDRFFGFQYYNLNRPNYELLKTFYNDSSKGFDLKAKMKQHGNAISVIFEAACIACDLDFLKILRADGFYPASWKYRGNKSLHDFVKQEYITRNKRDNKDELGVLDDEQRTVLNSLRSTTFTSSWMMRIAVSALAVLAFNSFISLLLFDASFILCLELCLIPGVAIFGFTYFDTWEKSISPSGYACEQFSNICGLIYRNINICTNNREFELNV